jgi:hypothetical protein
MGWHHEPTMRLASNIVYCWCTFGCVVICVPGADGSIGITDNVALVFKHIGSVMKQASKLVLDSGSITADLVDAVAWLTGPPKTVAASMPEAMQRAAEVSIPLNSTRPPFAWFARGVVLGRARRNPQTRNTTFVLGLHLVCGWFAMCLRLSAIGLRLSSVGL